MWKNPNESTRRALRFLFHIMAPFLINSLCSTSKGVISIIGAGGKTSLMFCLAKEASTAGKRVLTTTTTKIFFPDKALSPETLTAASARDLIEKSRAGLRRHSHFSAGRHHDRSSGKLEGFSRDIIDTLWQAGLFDWIMVEADGSRQKPLKATDVHEPVIPSSTTCLVLVAGLDSLGLPLDEAHVHRASIFSKNTGLGLGQIVDETAMAASIALEFKKAAGFCTALDHILVLNKADTPAGIESGRCIAGLLKANPGLTQVLITSLRDESCIKETILLNHQ
jgi:probable selenium-dependent hydroxylase accessory protein YqeC